MFGFHINSDPNIICDELIKYKDLKCLQLFVNINDKYKEEYLKFKELAIKHKINIVVHASYTINLAQSWDEYSWWISQLIMEITIANNIGAKAIILHLGKKLQLDQEIAINNMYSALLYVSNKLDKLNITNVKILLETSSGQGSEMCIKLDDLAKFINKLLNNKSNIADKFGICVDTCHIFNAGYDINTPKKVYNYFKEFDEKIGIKNIKVIQLNNSKTELGAKRDRHENLEYGKINLDGIKEVIKLCHKLGILLILETPDEHIDRDLKIIKEIYE
jgi:deoxyribonuclease-4